MGAKQIILLSVYSIIVYLRLVNQTDFSVLSIADMPSAASFESGGIYGSPEFE